MEDVVQVFFDSGTVFEDFVFVAGYFEAFLAFLHAHEGYVCEFYLVGGLVYSDGHGGSCCLDEDFEVCLYLERWFGERNLIRGKNSLYL